jgi:hypothetical protein
VYPNDTNEHGCPLHHQRGATSVIDFDSILDGLAPELRAAFEAERAERQQELDSYITATDYHP